MTFHYTQCGLLNVHVDGIRIEKDDAGDDVITIPGINELHQAIALGIVSHDFGMSGPELRFLRTELGLTQAALARLVHRDMQSIGRWERDEIKIDPTAEALIRRLAVEQLSLPSDLSIGELSQRSVPSAQIQRIDIVAKDGGNGGYDLAA